MRRDLQRCDDQMATIGAKYCPFSANVLVFERFTACLTCSETLRNKNDTLTELANQIPEFRNETELLVDIKTVLNSRKSVVDELAVLSLHAPPCSSGKSSWQNTTTEHCASWGAVAIMVLRLPAPKKQHLFYDASIQSTPSEQVEMSSVPLQTEAPNQSRQTRQTAARRATAGEQAEGLLTPESQQKIRLSTEIYKDREPATAEQLQVSSHSGEDDARKNPAARTFSPGPTERGGRIKRLSWVQLLEWLQWPEVVGPVRRQVGQAFAHLVVRAAVPTLAACICILGVMTALLLESFLRDHFLDQTSTTPLLSGPESLLPTTNLSLVRNSIRSFPPMSGTLDESLFDSPSLGFAKSQLTMCIQYAKHADEEISISLPCQVSMAVSARDCTLMANYFSTSDSCSESVARVVGCLEEAVQMVNAFCTDVLKAETQFKQSIIDMDQSRLSLKQLGWDAWSQVRRSVWDESTNRDLSRSTALDKWLRAFPPWLLHANDVRDLILTELSTPYDLQIILKSISTQHIERDCTAWELDMFEREFVSAMESLPNVDFARYYQAIRAEGSDGICKGAQGA